MRRLPHIIYSVICLTLILYRSKEMSMTRDFEKTGN